MGSISAPNAEPRAVASGCYGQQLINVRADSTLSACIRSLPLSVLHQLHFEVESTFLVHQTSLFKVGIAVECNDHTAHIGELFER